MQLTTNMLFDALCEATVGLLDHYSGENPELCDFERSESSYEMTSIIGLSDHSVAMAIVIACDHESAKNIAPVSEICLQDWLAELANQLAGRFKNKLAACGLTPSITIPVTIAGAGLEIGGSPKDRMGRCVVFDGGELSLSFVAEIRDDAACQRSATGVAEEGSMTLF